MPITLNGTGSITGISAGGLPDDCITTADIAAGAVTTAKITGGPAFSAYRNATQSVTSATWTKVQLNNEDFDTAGAFDSTANYRFTPLVAGYYLITFCVSGTTSYNEVLSAVYKNGSEYQWGSRTASTALSYTSSGSVVMYLNGSTDYVEVFAYLTGTTPSLSAANNRMTGCLLRPA